MTDRARSEQQDVSGFEDLFDQILEESEGDEIKIGEVIQAFGHRSFGPLILVPALLAALPTGAIPGVPILLGLLIVLVSGQLLLGRSSPWIPKRLRDIAVSRDVLKESWDRARPIFQRIDSHLRPRFTWMTKPPFVQAIAVLAIVLSVSMVPLEFVPFAVAIPGAAIAALGMGLATRDGLLVLLGLVLCGGTGWIIYASLS